MKAKLLGIALLILLNGCASTIYKPFESRGDGIVEGNGGTKTVQDGMEIWDYGDPPRKFKVLGIIEDERPGAPLPMSMLHGDVVKKARESGGQALIQLRSDAQVVAYQTLGRATATSYGTTTNITSTGMVAPIRRNYSRFAVIRYVD